MVYIALCLHTWLYFHVSVIYLLQIAITPVPLLLFILLSAWSNFELVDVWLYGVTIILLLMFDKSVFTKSLIIINHVTGYDPIRGRILNINFCTEMSN